MSMPTQESTNTKELMTGNEAIARGAIEAGVKVCASYPGTPSSEIPVALSKAAKETGMYVEWSVNEKVAVEVAGAASFSGIRSMSTMKNAGMNVASDFIQHNNLSGTGENGGGFVIVVCDDPSGHSSSDEQDTRWIARSANVPLITPASVNEAKTVMKYAFELSEKFKRLVVFRSYTRLSHAVGAVELGSTEKHNRKSEFDIAQVITPETPYIMALNQANHELIEEVRAEFEKSMLNSYDGPERPELLIVSSGSGRACSQEAVDILNLHDKVGILNLTTIWPLPEKLVQNYAVKAKNVLVAEETDPFIEIYVKEVLFDKTDGDWQGKVYGRVSDHIEKWGELSATRIVTALTRIFNLKNPLADQEYLETIQRETEEKVIERGAVWCPGCPLRPSFFAMRKALKKKHGFVLGDVGCHTLDIWPYGYNVTKLLHGMGTGAGLGSGFGKMEQFGFDQPVIAVTGDSGFFHSSFPGLINAVHNQASITIVVLDNSGAAMTGFQPHPGSDIDAMGGEANAIEIANLVEALGCDVAVVDPFDYKLMNDKLKEFIDKDEGVRVLILRRMCELGRMQKERRIPFRMEIISDNCKGKKCGICTKLFACPGLTIDKESKKAKIVDETCVGCGVCTEICPHQAIVKEKVIG